MKYFVALAVYFTATLYYTCCQKQIIKLPEISKANLSKVSWSDLKGFSSDDLKLSLEVFQKDCQKAKRYKTLKTVCQKSFDATNPELFFKTNFTPYQLIGQENQEEGLITGYYEPMLYGSLTKSTKYQYAIYKTPSNLLKIDLSSVYPELKKYRLRGKIVGNKVLAYSKREYLEDVEKEYLEPICFVSDKIDLFFLQIQGSGKVQLENGEVINIGYAQQNGRAYYPIGRKLIKDGYIKKENISLQSIKKWLEQNPTRIDEILNLNDSYVFFHKSSKIATGSLGVELVANRNLAVDRNFIPLGYPVFINTTNPINKTPINQLMVAADTGGAIKGDIRADFFFGNGSLALELAGKMKQKGKLYLFVPNNIN
ncbi:MAG: murein transglycosylase A [Campylobacterota bacterium]|nr:murein transglycosylase A [Campylobacterota bacterium]